MKRVAIIGGGFTGLTAAFKLAKKGHKVTILEKGEELGGLASGFKIEGADIEKAYHHLFKTDKDIINLARELGIDHKLEWHNSSLSIYYGGKLYPFTTPIDLLKFAPLNFFNRIRAGLVVLFLGKYSNWKKFTNITAVKWMKKWSGKQVFSVIWEPLLKGKFEQYHDKISMAWLWARLNIRANSKERGDTVEKLGYFDGGFKVIVDALEKRITKLGGEIRTESNVTKISTDVDDNVLIDINNETEVFDACISTLPSHIFAKLIESSTKDSEYLKKLNSIDYLGAVLLVFSSEQSLSKYYWHNINDVNSPFLVFIQHTNLISKSEYSDKNVYYIGSYVPHDHKYFEMDDNEIKSLWFKKLKSIFKDFKETEVREVNLFKFKNAQHIVDTDYESKIPDFATPLTNVYLSNFSQIFPEDRGTNYAVKDGVRIAELIIKDFNK